LNAAVPALIPLMLSLLYTLALRQGRPPGYDIDLFELWLKGSGFGPRLSNATPWP
jgi:hypothetical protein